MPRMEASRLMPADLRHPRKSERGASAILVAASFLLLMGVAAVAVDAGVGFNARTGAQTAADLSVVAGVIDIVIPTDAVDEIIATANANLDTTLTQADWAACTDPDIPTGFNSLEALDGTPMPCMSTNGRELRVKVPVQSSDTFFASLLNVNSLSTDAVAHAQFSFDAGDVMPFGVLASAPVGGEACLSGAPVLVPPCTAADSGNFGVVFAPYWGSPEKGTTAQCAGTPGDFLRQNIAIGLDHVVVPANPYTATGTPHPGTSAGLDGSQARFDACTLSGGVAIPTDTTPLGFANSLQTDTGFPGEALFDGLIGDTPSQPYPGNPGPVFARLLTIGLSSVTLVERDAPNFFNYTVDNTPLYDYLLSNDDMATNGISDPTRIECRRVFTPSPVWSSDPDAQMLTCLSTYVASGETGIIFDDAIGANKRLGFTPQFHHTTWPAGSAFQPIMGYMPVYLHRLWFNCNGSSMALSSGDACTDEATAPTSVRWTPGDAGPKFAGPALLTALELRLDQISALTLPITALPEEVQEAYPEFTGPFDITLNR